MTRILWWCWLIGGVVLSVPTESLSLEPRQAPRETASHRVIPATKNAAKAPSANDFMSPELLELFQEYQRLQIAHQADQQARDAEQAVSEPRLSPMPLPDTVAPAARELLQDLAEGSRQSAVEDMRKDISDVADKLNRQLQERLPVGTTIPQQDFPLPEMKTGQTLKELIEMIQQKQAQSQEAYQRAVEQYRNTWPSHGIPPREWIQKVQPFINKELVRQMAEARSAMSNKATTSSSSTPRPSERSSSSYGSSPSRGQGKSSGHSNAMVESLIKAFDTKSTSLIKAATNRKPDGRQSWWKSLRSKSKNKLSAWNRKLTKNSREVALQRSSYLRASSTKAPYNRQGGSSATGEGSLFTWVAGLLLLCLSVGLALFSFSRFIPSLQHPERAQRLDATTIRDRDSFLRACHQLASGLFGIRSRFWNHRQMFSGLAKAVDVEPELIRQLENIYEHARYAANSRSLSERDLRTARRLFADIQHRTLVTQ